MSDKNLNKTITKSTHTSRPTTRGLKRDWFLLDASKEPLGRLATKAACILMGKNRADFSKDQDMGGCVVIINADKTVLTGMKPKYKVYFRHTTRPGSTKTRTFNEQMQLDPTRPVYLAIKRMLPKNRHQDIRMNQRLKIFAGENTGLTQKLISAN